MEVMIEKRAGGRGLRQSVGWLAALFPSLAASRFDLEAPLTLEETCARLEKLTQVRKVVTAQDGLWNNVLDDMVMAKGSSQQHSTSKIISPIEVRMVSIDADTVRYEVVQREARFRIVIRGYLKRWEAGSTVVNGKVRFDLHYLSVLIKSLIYTPAGIVGSGVILFLLSLFPIFGQIPLISTPLRVAMRGDILPITLALFWLAVLAGVWFNDVILQAPGRRLALLERLEMLLLMPSGGALMEADGDRLIEAEGSNRLDRTRLGQ